MRRNWQIVRGQICSNKSDRVRSNPIGAIVIIYFYAFDLTARSFFRDSTRSFHRVADRASVPGLKGLYTFVQFAMRSRLRAVSSTAQSKFCALIFLTTLISVAFFNRISKF